MAETYKTEIIRELFRKRWDPTAQTLSNPMVTTVEIREEHAAYRQRRGELVENTNPPAFMKDFLRKRHTANKNWPPEIFQAGFTARQVTGDGKNFEFIPIQPGQTEPFTSTAPAPPPDVPAHPISSIGLPLASRRLGRTDEPWLVQVSVRLHVIESYFALFSTRKNTVRQVDHLQNALKLRRTEIDALFLGIEEPEPGKFEEFIITCEAKRVGEDIISEQVLQQVRAVFKLLNVNQRFAVPIALKSVGPSRIHVVEYTSVSREDAEELEELTIANQAVFELVPSVPGIGEKQQKGNAIVSLDDLDL
jgi:hypothetical protein